MSDTGSPDHRQTPQPRSRRLMLAIGALVLLAAAAGGAWYVRHSRPSKSSEPPQPRVEAVLHLEDFVVNVPGDQGGGYLRVGIDLGLSATSKSGEGKPEAPTALVRDTILNVLMATPAAEFGNVEGKAKLKETLLSALQKRAPELHVHEVYYTQFLIQN